MVKINLYGAPSSGKSTLAGQIFAELKGNNKNVVFVQEYAKELVYQGVDMRTLKEADRVFILGEQLRRESIFEGQVDYLVTDSPLLLTAFYHQDPEGKEDWSYGRDIALRHLTNKEFHFWLEPTENFEKEGRSHSKNESLLINYNLKKYLEDMKINLHIIKGTPKERLILVMKNIKEGIL